MVSFVYFSFVTNYQKKKRLLLLILKILNMEKKKVFYIIFIYGNKKLCTQLNMKFQFISSVNCNEKLKLL